MGWFSSGFRKFLLWSKDNISLWVEEDVEISAGFKPFVQKAVYVLFLSSLALGGAIVGGVVGGIKGYSLPTGFLRGAAIGAMATIVSLVHLLELIVHGEPFSKVAFLCSLFDGKNFNEWFNPALLKAYQWMMEMEHTISFDGDIDQYQLDFDTLGGEMTGLSAVCIEMLPKYKLITSHLTTDNNIDDINGSLTRSPSCCSCCCCPICLEDLREGEVARKLPRCQHSFHVDCIDQWLRQCGSCPLCRQQLLDND